MILFNETHCIFMVTGCPIPQCWLITLQLLPWSQGGISVRDYEWLIVNASCQKQKPNPKLECRPFQFFLTTEDIHFTSNLLYMCVCESVGIWIYVNMCAHKYMYIYIIILHICVYNAKEIFHSIVFTLCCVF